MTGHAMLVLVGGFAAGKSTVARQLADATGSTIYEVGDIIREKYSQEQAIGISEYIDKAVSADRHVWAKEILSRIRRDRDECPIVVGIRMREEIALVRVEYPSAVIVGLDADLAIRCARLANREAMRSSGGIPWELRAERELRTDLKGAIESADHVVDATQTLEAVVNQIAARWIGT